MEQHKGVRLFGLTVMSVENAVTVFVMTFIIFFAGLFTYISMAKESFPEIVIPTIYVQSIYPGNSPVDMENQVGRHIDKQLKSLQGVKTFKTTCIQDAAVTIVEFNANVKVEKALQEVKDAVDKAKIDLPKDNNFREPSIKEINFQDIPFVTVNVAGNFSKDELRKYGEYFQDEFEKLPEVSEAVLKGVEDREVKIDLDVNKMKGMMLSFNDVAYAIQGENMTISGGDIKTNGMGRSIRVVGEFKSISDIENLIIKSEFQNSIFLRDIVSSPIKLDFEEPTSFARMNGEAVVSLDVKKRSGMNLISAAYNVRGAVENAYKTKAIPKNLKVTFFNDQSVETEESVSNLENSIISGVILVVLILLFFLGLRNASIVGLAIPLSMLLGFLVLGIMGIKMNMVVLFGLILALGMLVDNAIVVVENCYRFLSDGYSKWDAAKLATSEVAMPIIGSTATTLAAFIPLMGTPGIMGEFIWYLPVTLIITLSASLFVALVINPVFIAEYMKLEARDTAEEKKSKTKNILLAIATMVLVGILAWISGVVWVRNLCILGSVITASNFFFLRHWSLSFQERFLPWLENAYGGFVRWSVKRPWSVFFGTIGLMVLSGILLGLRAPKTMFFPSGEPKYVNVFVEKPIGTDIRETDKLTKELEARINKAIAPYKKIVDAVLAQVGKDTGDPSGPPQPGSSSSNMARITVNFVKAAERDGVSTLEVMEKIRESVKGYAGVTLVVDKNQDGPPTGKPINIEITGPDNNSIENLLGVSSKVISFINEQKIAGIEGLQTDVRDGKPELLVEVDRENVRRFGASTSDVAMAIRTALFGSEVSKFKQGEDDYKIFVRIDEKKRYDINELMSMNVTFRNQSNGRMVALPISSLATVKYTSTYNSVQRKDSRRTLTVYSNVLREFNSNEVVAQVKGAMATFKMPDGYTYEFTGEQEKQNESQDYFSKAMLIAMAAIFLILVAQFNSLMGPVIIMFSVLFSTIGVFLGYVITGSDLVIFMFFIGIISLAGVVVNNAIVLIDYSMLLVKEKKIECGIPERGGYLEDNDVRDILVKAGITRLRPVLLTAITTVLGLIPLAIGLNINFITLITKSDPQVFIGGDSVAFWGPLSWTVIYGLTFATILTLVVVPCMYLIFMHLLPKRFSKKKKEV